MDAINSSKPQDPCPGRNGRASLASPGTRSDLRTLHEGTPPKVGDKVTRPELAKALRLVAEQGPEAFYKGPLGEAAVAAVKAAGGVLTMDDLAAYRVREREPLRAPLDGYEIVTMPPPSSGGVCVIESLNVLEQMGRPSPARL